MRTAGVSPAARRRLAGESLARPFPRARRPRAASGTLALLLLVAFTASAQTNEPPKLPGKVAIQQKLGWEVPLDLTFRDEQGKIVRLRDYFRGKPVLLNFVYFNCPMLCPMTLEGLTSSLTEMKFNVGKEFDIITVSIDPRDKPSQAAAFKDRYVRKYGRLDAAYGWHFLTGTDSNIKRLADSVGFQYAYDVKRDQFAHAAAVLVLTPQGRTSRYFYGFEFKPRDLRLAVVEASGGKIGSATDQFLLLCYHYDPAIGKYSRNAMNFVRAGGVATLMILTSFVVVMLRREKAQPHSRPAEGKFKD